ncbi:MAG: hypothetical protein MO846_06810 [Candidatus Devosia symbiotica]|nr:hypothetical protein [Candidatus Devosia symbiotica]
MWTTKKITLMFLSGVASVALVSQASALEAQAFVDRVAAVYNSFDYNIEFGPATLNSDAVTVQGVTVSVAATGGEPMHFDTELTFSGVSELADGGYHADSLTIPDIETEFATDPKGKLSMSDIRVDDLYIPGGDTVSGVAMLQLYGSISTGPLSLRRNGVEVASYESFETGSDFNPAQGSAELVDISSSMMISGIMADLSTVSEEDPGAGAIIEALGLTTISGDISEDVTWSMADGHLSLNKFLIDFADVGSLDLTAEVTGLTPAVLEQISAMQASMSADGTSSDEKAQAQMMQSMAIMQDVSIVGASLRYDDASLAGKLLDFFAAQSGTDRASFVAGLKSMLPIVIGEVGIPALVDLVVPPVSAFLDNPESLEIDVAPPSPTSALVLMTAAANPASLIKALGLAVQTNMTADE